MKKILFFFLLAFTCNSYAQNLDNIMKEFHNSKSYKEKEEIALNLTPEQQYLIGLKYYQNNKKNKMAAKAWLTSSAKRGNSKAKKLLNKLYKEEDNNADFIIINKENFDEDLPNESMYLTSNQTDNEGNTIIYLKIQAKLNKCFFRVNFSGRNITLYVPNENGEYTKSQNNFFTIEKEESKTIKLIVNKNVVTNSMNITSSNFTYKVLIKGANFKKYNK